MIEMLEGVPGSGKSYYAVSERLLKWVRAGRRVYCFVDGFFLDRLALFENRDILELKKQITLWMTPDEVKVGLLLVEPGSAVLLDEVQTVFRSKEKQDPELLRWLETHRHKGIDLVMMCQQYGQVTLGVNRLVEGTIKFRRLDRFGLKNRYQAAVRGNPEEAEVIRMFSGKYDPKLYQYYSSYSSAAVRETARGGSILKSPTLILGLLGLVVAIGWFSFGGWLSGAKASQPAEQIVAKGIASKGLPPPPPLPVLSASFPVSVVEQPLINPLRIQGGMTVFKDGKEVWLWVSQDGRLMTEDEIVYESGGSVSSRMVRGVRVLKGSGVVYGGQADVSVPMVSIPAFNASTSAQAVVAVPVLPAQPDVPAVSPGDLLASPPGLLSTPPAL